MPKYFSNFSDQCDNPNFKSEIEHEFKKYVDGFVINGGIKLKS